MLLIPLSQYLGIEKVERDRQYRRAEEMLHLDVIWQVEGGMPLPRFFAFLHKSQQRQAFWLLTRRIHSMYKVILGHGVQ